MIFAIIALLIAAFGIYGVIAHNVAQRTQEIGVRLTLGAQPGDILKLVLGQGLAVISIGVGVGLAGAFGLTRTLSSWLFGVSATDPIIIVAVSLFLGIVAVLACYVPVRQAMKVDPMAAIRYE
jgi:putative ABC transport system permease protein